MGGITLPIGPRTQAVKPVAIGTLNAGLLDPHRSYTNAETGLAGPTVLAAAPAPQSRVPGSVGPAESSVLTQKSSGRRFWTQEILNRIGAEADGKYGSQGGQKVELGQLFSGAGDQGEDRHQ